MITEPFAINIAAPKAAVFNYLADIDNFSEWATEFCIAIKKQQPHYKITTAIGELYLRIQADFDSGDIKYFATQEPDGQDYMSSKVRYLDENNCLYVINFSQTQCIPDDVYQQQCRAIKIELQNIKNNFS